MNFRDFYTSFKNKWEAVIIIIILAATFGLYVNFFLPHYYQAHTEYLIIQNQNPNIDAYTAIKGSEQLAYTFKQIVLSPAFFERISGPSFDVQAGYFGQEPKKIIKKWQKTVLVETVPNTGILKIDILHPDQREAQKISQAVAYEIINERNLFWGENQQVNVLSLGKSIISNRPVKPNALVNTFLGLMAGLALSFALIVFFPNNKIMLRSGNTQKELKTKPDKDIKSKKTSINESLVLNKKAAAPSNLPIA